VGARLTYPGAVPSVLIYGNTATSAALRHEVPLEIADPFLFAEHDGRTLVVTSALESARIARALPHAELLLDTELGMLDLVEDGLTWDEAELEVVSRAVEQAGIEAALVPPDLPVAVADRLRADGVTVAVDGPAFERRRRRKTGAELEGIRRAQAAAEAGMAAAAQLLREAEPEDGLLARNGAPLTAEVVRAAAREACAAAGAPAPASIMVVSVLSGGGHDPGSGPLPANLPIVVDLWPRDETAGCWADMSRTFVVGTVSQEVARLCDTVREALEAARAAIRPGITGRKLYDIAADVIEQAGHPTQRTRRPGETLTHGFQFSLGHGVGLEVHEAPALGLAGHDALVEGDVIAIEPGVDAPGIGGVHFEDLVLVTSDGCETLTNFGYDLAP
jgi:Xaa-Pro aminopeptidase